MGPRLVRRGSARGLTVPTLTGFNGAAPGSARKCARMRRNIRRVASMGPRLVRRGSQRQSTRMQYRRIVASMGPRLVRRGSAVLHAPLTVHRFNGAAPGSARKCRGDDRLVGQRTSASMGPRLVRRGSPISWQCADSCGFNGAAPGSARKYLSHPAMSRTTSLQWGRAWFGAEVLPHGYHERHGLIALQWGRAWFGAEVGTARQDVKTRDRLQWGRAWFGAEVPVPVVARLAWRWRFNGAAPGSARKCRNASSRTHDRFNGAAPGSARKSAQSA